MPQLLALEWNGSEARLALASGRGGQVVIEQAFSVPLASQQPGAENEEVDVGGRIAAALAAKGIGRIDALVGLGRTNIKLRQLHLPAALDDELPEMVRLQAMQEFNDLDEQWLLDFVSIDHTPDGPRTVLVAAVEPELVQQIQDVCQSAGLKMRRLIPRAYAAASLVGRAGSGRSDQLRLLVDLLDDEADLTAMIDGKVVFLRSTRLSGAPSQSNLSPEDGRPFRRAEYLCRLHNGGAAPCRDCGLVAVVARYQAGRLGANVASRPCTSGRDRRKHRQAGRSSAGAPAAVDRGLPGQFAAGTVKVSSTPYHPNRRGQFMHLSTRFVGGILRRELVAPTPPIP